jgi:Domain of unknown function (DUF1929)
MIPSISEIGISLIGAVSSIHDNSMDQRTIILTVSCVEITCIVTAPLNADVCPLSRIQMFFLDRPRPNVRIYVRVWAIW